MWPLSANTSASLRNRALIRGLEEMGCEVDVVTVISNEKNPFNDTELAATIPEHWQVIGQRENNYQRIVSESRGLIGKLKQVALPVLRRLYHLSQLYDHSQLYLKQIQLSDIPKPHYHLIISSSDPKTSHLAVEKWMQLGLRADRWIQYWGDPLAHDITKKHILPFFYVKSVERKILQHANRIVYVSPFTLAAQQALFPQLADRMKWLPIPYLAIKRYADKSHHETHGHQPKLKLGYFGDYKSNVRNIMPLVEVCQANPHKYELFLAGNTDVTITETENLHVMPRISQTELETLETDCDLLICLLNKSGTQIPGKVYHYAATNKPVLILLDGEYVKQMEDYFRLFHRYVCCLNQNKSIEETLDALSLSELSAEPSAHFAPKTIAEQFLQM
jgi:hypothetical protein